MSLSRPRRGREEEEEQDGGPAAGEGSTPAKRPRGCSCPCCFRHQGSKDFYEGQIEILKKEMRCLSKGFIEERKTFQREMQEFYRNSQLQLQEQITEQNRRMEQLIREQFNTFISEIRKPGDHIPENSNLRTLSHQSKTTTYRLRFENKCCKDKYSGHAIMADDGNPVKIAIYDHDSKIITNGPFSTMQVKIVVLDGEFNKENKDQWGGDSFLNNIIVHGRPGKPPLFANELYLRLKNGVANLCGVKFQDNVPGKKFRLGVMAADDSISEKILEGISEPFNIKSGRGFLNKKDSDPSLCDPIYKLKKIRENGDRHKLLQQMHINRVQDFLWFYNKDINSLREACRSISDHDWDIIVGHALSCKQGHEYYFYQIPGEDAIIFFNSHYKIVGAKFKDKYTSYEELNGTEKGLVEVSKNIAYDYLKVVQYEDNSYFDEHQVRIGDNGSSYLRGSSSMLQLPLPPAGFHGGASYHGDTLENPPALQSPRPLQRWVKIVTVVKTLHFWNKKTEMSAFIREMMSFPVQEGSFGMPDMSDN